MSTVVIPAYAKINWVLRVVGRRPDGYHELDTVFQTVSLCDVLSITPTDDGEIRLTCDHPGLAADGTNLVERAAHDLRAAAGVSSGAIIHLEKKIPMGAGLGGGSGDAGATLLALNALWRAGASPETLWTIAARLGADVPFFLSGGTARGTGRGDVIEPMPDVHAPHLLLVNPGIEVPTARVFRHLSAGLTSEKPERILPACSFSPGDGLPASLTNDLEETVFALFPPVEAVWRKTRALGARAVRMSGSGATIFAVFDSESARARAQADLATHGWSVWACRAVSRKEYLAGFEALSNPT